MLQQTEHYPDIRFFLCPNCNRRYALAPGQQLTFRWLHPLTLALQAIIFDAMPIERVPEIARRFAAQYSREELSDIVKEIRRNSMNPRSKSETPWIAGRPNENSGITSHHFASGSIVYKPVRND